MRVQLTVSSLPVAHDLVDALGTHGWKAAAESDSGPLGSHRITVVLTVSDVTEAALARRLAARLDHPSAVRRLAPA